MQRPPPLQVYSELLQPRRPDRPEWELALFDGQRVYNRLAGLTLHREVSTMGMVSLGRTLYSIDPCHTGKQFW